MTTLEYETESRFTPIFEWFEVNGPSFLSSVSFLLLLVFTQTALPQQTPQSFCSFPSNVNDIFIWLLVPFAFIIIIGNGVITVMRNRQFKGKDAGWIPPFFNVLSSLIVAMVTLATICYGFSQKFTPVVEREGWILRQCSTFTMIRFSLIYGVFLLNSLIPLYTYRP